MEGSKADEKSKGLLKKLGKASEMEAAGPALGGMLGFFYTNPIEEEETLCSHVCPIRIGSPEVLVCFRIIEV